MSNDPTSVRLQPKVDRRQRLSAWPADRERRALGAGHRHLRDLYATNVPDDWWNALRRQPIADLVKPPSSTGDRVIVVDTEMAGDLAALADALGASE